MLLEPHVSTSRAGRAATARCSRRRWLAAAAASLVTPGVAADDEQPVIVNQPVADAQIELQFAPGFDARLRAEGTRLGAPLGRCGGGVLRRLSGATGRTADAAAVDGGGVRGGVAFGVPSLFIRIRLGRDTTREQFLGDWIMAHEMVQLRPRLPRSQNWLHEGIATYVEGVARPCRAGAGSPRVARVGQGHATRSATG